MNLNSTFHYIFCDGPHNISASAVMFYLDPGAKDWAIVYSVQFPMMKGYKLLNYIARSTLQKECLTLHGFGTDRCQPVNIIMNS